MRTGLLFGLSSGVITTLGLVVGLNAGTESRLAVLGGIVVIAVADALSDALGIHIAEESDATTDAGHVWAATFATFASKFVVAATFAVPVLLLPLDTAVVVAIAWGLLVVAGSSWWLAAAQGNRPLHAIVEHVLIAAGVVVVSHGVGVWVQGTFADEQRVEPAGTVSAFDTPARSDAMDLGAFSVSLAVKDLAASRDFYGKLGFEPVGGDADQGWLILANGGTVIGLFQGMFEQNILTFNPGWQGTGQEVEGAFTDVRELQRRLAEQGVEFSTRADESTTGPASFVIVDPDGNPVLVDQHR